ncbi:MAG: hypothetical protein KA310_03245 [Pseudomonadales bacterium]|nr:hypothetical protein [Pseudomonadales bacterium]
MLRRRTFGAADDVSLELQLDATLDELNAGFRWSLVKYGIGSGLFPGDQVIQDLFGGSSIANALKQTHRTLSLLGGDLYEAVLGRFPFPLEGTSPNVPAALASWNQLAQDVRDTLGGIFAYTAKWGPLPGLKTVAKDPFLWPWWLQLTAAAVALSYGMKALAFVGRARQTAREARGSLGGFPRKRRRK